jgi:hypothetical protein
MFEKRVRDRDILGEKKVIVYFVLSLLITVGLSSKKLGHLPFGGLETSWLIVLIILDRVSIY